MPADLLASLPVSDGSAEQHHVGGGVSGDVDGVAGSRQCLSGPRHPNFVTQALELMVRRPNRTECRCWPMRPTATGIARSSNRSDRSGTAS